MRKLKKITMMLMTVFLLIGMFGINAFASETGSTANPTIEGFKIYKTLQIDKNVQTFPSFKFAFKVKQITSLPELAEILNSSDKLSIREDLGGVVELQDFIVTDYNMELPDVEATYTYSSEFRKYRFGAVKDANGADTDLFEHTSSWPLLNPDNTQVLDPNKFPDIGFYVFRVTEYPIRLELTTSDEQWNVSLTPKDELICSQAEFIMIIPVGWNEDYTSKEFVYTDAIILKTKNDDGSPADVKVAAPNFVNVYQRNDSDEYGLEILKQIDGDYGDPTKAFTFSIDIGRNATEEASVDGYTYAIYNRTYQTDAEGNPTEEYTDAKVEGSDGTILFEPENNVEQTFALKHNQVLKFDKFPVGTTYTFTENPEGYTPEAIVTEGTSSTTLNSTTGNVANDGTLLGAKGTAHSEAFVILEGQDKVDVTNTYGTTVVTGIVTDNLSFILLVAVAVVGMTAYAVMKKYLKYY